MGIFIKKIGILQMKVSFPIQWWYFDKVIEVLSGNLENALKNVQ